MARLIKQPKPGIFSRVPAWAAPANRQKAGALPSQVYGTSRTLVVGPAPSPEYPAISPDFRTIGEAMSAVPLPVKKSGGEVELAAPQDTWTILVMPGVYVEEIRMKPNVILVGIGQSAVIFPPQAPGEWKAPQGGRGRRAIVYMNHNTAVQNLVFGKLGMTPNDYVFWNFDTYDLLVREKKVQVAPSGLGITDVWVWPYPVSEPRGGLVIATNPKARPPVPADPRKTKGKTLLMEGNWHTALFTNLGSSYWDVDGYDIEVRGEDSPEAMGTPKDCHFSNCFFDALFIEEESGGCVLVDNAIDVHLRNSLMRIGAVEEWKNAHIGSFVPGACVRVQKSGLTPGTSYAWLESSHLESPGNPTYRVLDVQDGSRCSFRGSSADSIRGEANIDWPAWPKR